MAAIAPVSSKTFVLKPELVDPNKKSKEFIEEIRFKVARAAKVVIEGNWTARQEYLDDVAVQLFRCKTSAKRLVVEENFRGNIEEIATVLAFNKKILITSFKCSLIAEELQTLGSFVAGSSTLRYVDFSGNSIPSLTNFAYCFTFNVSVTNYDFAYCDLSEADLITLFTGLSTNPKVTSLTVSHNDFTKPSVDGLAILLFKTRSLKKLAAVGCGITKALAPTVFGSVVLNTTLTALDVSSNPLQDSCELIGETTRMRRLEELNLNDCSLNESSLYHFTRKLLEGSPGERRKNSQLLKLELKQNKDLPAAVMRIYVNLFDHSHYYVGVMYTGKDNKTCEVIARPDRPKVTIAKKQPANKDGKHLVERVVAHFAPRTNKELEKPFSKRATLAVKAQKEPLSSIAEAVVE